MNTSTFTTRNLVLSAILLGVGFVLHAVTPPLFFGVKPDFMLACMFVAIIINPNIKNTVVIGAVGGIIGALTTGFPGGQLPSVIDKFCTALFIFAMIQIFSSLLKSEKTRNAFVCCLGFAGTLVSGTIFLGSALLMFGLPAPFSALFLTVVLPTAVVNAVVALIIYKVFNSVGAYAQ